MVGIISEISQILIKISEHIKQCENVSDIVIPVYSEWVEKLNDPLVLGRILETARKDFKTRIERDIAISVSKWKNKQYKASGEKLGGIMYILFVLCFLHFLIALDLLVFLSFLN